jgi:uncharacterized protein YutE (UPF0331/DUF86 family)
MSPVDAAIIRRKLGHIMTALGGLAPLAQLSVGEYRSRFYERKAAERLLQEAIEAALDINAHLIAEQGSEVPEDYHGGFIKMGEMGILQADFARSLAPSAGLRNRLVHEYDAVDDAKVLQAIGAILESYPRYVQAIEAFLGKAGQ